MRNHSPKQQRFYGLAIFWLGCLAAILYSSWPLGFVLDPWVSRHELASMLEAPHQPYNWVFILTDVLTGVIISAMAVKQLYKRHVTARYAYTVGLYWTFGLLVGLAALTPLNCNPEAGQCGSLLSNPYIIVHGFASIGSSVSLFISLAILGFTVLKRQTKLKIQIAYAILIGSWFFFGIGSLAELALGIKGNILQYFFITLCSLTVLAVGVWLETLPQTNSKQK